MTGIQDLYLNLEVKKYNPKVKNKLKTKLYIYGITILSIILSALAGLFFAAQNIVLGIAEAIILFIPITEIITKITQNILSKCVKPKLIPKMDFSKGVPKECSTMIVIPSIVKSRRRRKKTLRKTRSILSSK